MRDNAYWVDKHNMPLSVGDKVTVFSDRTILVGHGYTVGAMEIEFVVVTKKGTALRKWPHNLEIEDSALTLDEGL